MNRLLQWLFSLQEEQEATNRQMEELNRFTEQTREEAERAANDTWISSNNNMFGGGFGGSGMGMF